MEKIKNNLNGVLICFIIAVLCLFLGNLFPIIGGPVIGLLIGMIISLIWIDKKNSSNGINFTSKYILQTAVVLLGFGLNLNVIFKTGIQSLPIIIATILTALIVAYIMMKLLNMERKTSILIGVGSSICGGSAIAATAPIINAKDEEISQSISVIFFFNALAAILFPILGRILGFSTVNGDAFGIFAGTAINDTSSVTAAAATWDNMWGLGSSTLDKAVTVKLTRTLAIIPIALILSLLTAKQNKNTSNNSFNLKSTFPIFILYFIIASIITTITINFGVSPDLFMPLKELSKFFIIMAMVAIGLNSNLIKMIKNGGKAILLGATCWTAITVVSLILQNFMNIW